MGVTTFRALHVRLFIVGEVVVVSLCGKHVYTSFYEILCALWLCAVIHTCIVEPLYRGHCLLSHHIELCTNLPLKNKGHLFNEDTVCSPNHIELCTNLPLN